MKYYIITYGCQMNKSDSERIATILESQRYQPAQNQNEADLIVVNMCSVRQSAVDRIFGLSQKFSKLKTQNSNLKTILTGCILKKDRKKFQKVFDLTLDIKDLPKLKSKLQPKSQKLLNRKNKLFIDYFHIQPKYSDKTLAYVPIMTGCNNFCSYCVVPFTRGKEISRPINEILREVKNLVEKGYKEIVLLGQNVNSYHSKLKSQNSNVKTKSQISKLINFSSLLKLINNLSGKFKISFLTSHPKDFSDELIDIIAKSEKIKKEIHLPVQSGDNEILKKMNRGYTIEEYKNLIKKIKNKIPNVKLSTDVIVGFPGETKKQFQNTVKLFKEIKFDYAYIAKYSPRFGTAAFKLKDNVPLGEKKQRYKVLNTLIEKKPST